MEPLAYLYLTQEYESSEIRELVFLRNWSWPIAPGKLQRSGQVAVSLFSVASAAWMLGGAELVLAEQAPKEFVPVILGGKYTQSYAGGGYYYVLEDNEFDDRPAYAVVESSYASGGGSYHPVRPDSSAQALCGVFKEGDSGEGVACLQELLQKAGYFDSAVTGYFGKITCDAVAAFQRDRGLYVDGVAGPQTLEALQQSTHS